ncbi:MAG: ABC-2 family transporter protein [Fimbriimonadia bacterium]|jgi:ABC-2 type transport system permease protein
MIALARKSYAYFRIILTEMFIYRGAAFLWIIADSMTALVLPLVWIAAASGEGYVGGLSVQQIVLYYVAALVLSQFVVSHMMWDIAYEIREGIFSAYLVRPMNYFWSQFVRNIAWRVGKLIMFLPLFVAMLVGYHSLLIGAKVHVSPLLIVVMILGHTLSFVNAFSLGLIALRTQEAYSIIRLYYLPEMFLSGRLFPLAMLPDWAATGAMFTPFRYTVAFPVEMMLGRVSDEAVLVGIGAQLCWIALMSGVGWVLWRTGLKTYTGVGM